tara:strand:+ start:10268 stop:10816 length:549 start_codon:yes stop_codon:yes gene_type:complete
VRGFRGFGAPYFSLRFTFASDVVPLDPPLPFPFALPLAFFPPRRAYGFPPPPRCPSSSSDRNRRLTSIGNPREVIPSALASSPRRLAPSRFGFARRRDSFESFDRSNDASRASSTPSRGRRRARASRSARATFTAARPREASVRGVRARRISRARVATAIERDRAMDRGRARESRSVVTVCA